ncbi:tripartite tricarboxylate transporter substrate binding protein [Marinovum sp. 2_MG-2023]|uniref:Bug family tripartite tricarboxylate transporter substrate binding protein n=1 Tax=Roseobacteraceae TaxID=2854170 RepID=UPI001FD5E51D|nr:MULTISPECIES: tripartite tricarboxylate transporter substrate binding protein [Roseobacteraceae]MCJ7873849.1 tripartite tricarboxylate transporter substrate binding protein [Phaeobacter sp. J2-8]MDO6731136.1 tripartite tricarboxylate transporter substrate binding protein [Marinovum sp. 2_MG-2023]MDO6778633.1 tripartite tricarboxylate transporter substrate binding protein [Marinovum sp. 1_MG-2023]
MNRTTTALGLGALALALSASTVLAEDFPSRPIEVSVWASAGGGTDTTNRYLAEAMQEQLGGRINVVNRTGGGGGVAMNQVWSQPHDGYAWLGASEGMQVAKVLEYHQTGTQDWRWYIVGGSPGVISVNANSKYETLDELITASKENPGSVKIGHCALGCVWHMKALSLGQGAQAEFNYIPFEGSAPAQVGALTGEVDAVVSSVSEQAEYIKAGKFRPLAMIEMQPYQLGDMDPIPAAGVTYPDIQKIPARQWLGMAVPKDLPEEVTAKIDAAFEKAMKAPKIQSLANERYMALSGAYGPEAEAELDAMERAMSYKLHELGIAATDPAELGILAPDA